MRGYGGRRSLHNSEVALRAAPALRDCWRSRCCHLLSPGVAVVITWKHISVRMRGDCFTFIGVCGLLQFITIFIQTQDPLLLDVC